jgi:HEPN domain-containing protein
MNARPEVVEILRQWVRKAEHHLEAASPIMSIEAWCPFAGKYLKCPPTYLGIQTPRTHDLKALVSLVPAQNRLALQIEDVVELNPYSVDVRYADDWREPDLGDARRALALASEVRAEVRQAILPAALV